MLFEYLVVGWEIAGLPLDDQKMLVGRYRMADSDTQSWVRRTIAQHLESTSPSSRTRIDERTADARSRRLAR